MQKPLLFPITSVIYLEPNKPLDLGVLQSCAGELSLLGLSGGSSDLRSLGPQRTSLGRLFHAIVCACFRLTASLTCGVARSKVHGT